jgi:putative ABC transport system permease protein
LRCNYDVCSVWAVPPHLLGLGAVSLGVAGVAIFNGMLVSTTERRGEIGLRRAVGVEKCDIFRALLVESTRLGILGGSVGFS